MGGRPAVSMATARRADWLLLRLRSWSRGGLRVIRRSWWVFETLPPSDVTLTHSNNTHPHTQMLLPERLKYYSLELTYYTYSGATHRLKRYPRPLPCNPQVHSDKNAHPHSHESHVTRAHSDDARSYSNVPTHAIYTHLHSPSSLSWCPRPLG